MTDDFWKISWRKAVLAAEKETGISSTQFPTELPWAMSDILNYDWFPKEAG